MSLFEALGLPAKLATIQNAAVALHVDELADNHARFSLVDRSLGKPMASPRVACDALGRPQLELDHLDQTLTQHLLPLVCTYTKLDRVRVDPHNQGAIAPLKRHGFHSESGLVDGSDVWSLWVRKPLDAPPEHVDLTEQRALARQCAQTLGMPYEDGKLTFCPESPVLVSIGNDRFDRPQRLAPMAARQWQAMQSAAPGEAPLEVVSAYRGMRYQMALLDRKLQTGQQLQDIMLVNTPPGFSQHHTGHALDLAAPDQEALTEAFEDTKQFAWLQANASRFGFHMSYPRNNPWGLSYEPWHWAWQAH